MKATITATKNYKLFDFSLSNRTFNPGKHRLLLKSLKEHGYDPARPIVCFRNERNRLEVVDGQHRLNFCRELGIPVYYTISEHTDPIEYNAPSVGWSIHDYLKAWACKGSDDYATLIQFAHDHKLPVTTAANMLAGLDNTSGGAVVNKMRDGSFKVIDLPFATRCASAVNAIGEHFKEARSFYFVAAMIRCLKVPEFDINQLISKLRKHPGILKPCARVDQYLQDIETAYNFANKKGLIPLRFMANQAAKK